MIVAVRNCDSLRSSETMSELEFLGFGDY